MTAADWIVYGTVPWEVPWLNEQNLAHALAQRGHRVLYVGPPVSPLTPLRAGSRSPRTLAALLKRRPERHGNVHVFRPVALPPLEHRRAARLSRPLVRRQIARAAATVGIDAPVLVAMRSWRGLEGAAGERLRVYFMNDWIEAGAEILGRSRAELASEWRETCAGADLVCAVSRQMQEALARHGFQSTVLTHGFHADLAPLYDAPEPPEYSGLERPLLGYAGNIDARLDFEGLRRLAEEVGTVVLVGRVSPRLPAADRAVLESTARIELLGIRSRAELPPYISHLDCSLMPYRASEWARYGSPMKLWDYLYAGPPIVGSGYLALRDYPPPLVHFAEEGALVQTVSAALEGDAEGPRRTRRETALVNTWDVRAEQLEQAALRVRDG